MARHFLKRLLPTLPALWLVLTLVFLMIHIVPGNPAEQTPLKADHSRQGVTVDKVRRRER